MNLFIECPRCTKANKMLAECEESLRKLECLPRDFKRQRVECTTCSNRGATLTEEGKRLVELLRPFFAQAPESDIPF